jgi:autotransporter-associated beta strand protein
VLADGGTYTDSAAGLTVKQISHDANAVTVVVALCDSAAQPYTLVLTSEQLAAQTPVLADVAGGSACNPLTITAFDALTPKGGTVTLTNNLLFYTPPGVFDGNDTFQYTVTNLLGAVSASTVTVVTITQPHYYWDANGAAAGTGGAGAWDTTSLSWDNGTNRWPGTGTSNCAIFAGTAGTVSIASSGVAANGLVFQSSGYVVQSNTLTLSGTSPTVFVEANDSATINSVVAGSSGLTKSWQGTLTLGGANTFTGGANIIAGAVKASKTTSLASGPITLCDTNTGADSASLLFGGLGSGAGPANSIAVAPYGVGTVTLGSYAGPYQQWTSPIVLNRAATFTDGTGDRTTFTGPISGNVGTLTIAGHRITFANSGNSFTGKLVVPAGSIFQSDAATVLPSTTSVQVDGVFQLNNGGTQNINALTGSGDITIIAGAPALLSLGNAGGSGTFSGNITNGANTLSLLKTGSGSQTLSGASAYTGGTTLRQGTLVLGNATAAGAGSVNLGDASSGSSALQLTLNADAIANAINVTTLGSGTATIYATSQYNDNTGTIAMSRPTTLSVYNSSGADWWFSFNNLAGNVGTLTLNGASGGNNRLVLGTTNTFSGNVVVQQGRVQLNSAGNFASNNVTVNAGTDIRVWGGDQALNSLAGSGNIYSDNGTTRNLLLGARNGSGTYSGVISQNLSLTKAGTGTQILTAASTYTGGTTLTGGTLQIGNGTNTGSVAGSIVNNATLSFYRSDAPTVTNTMSGNGTINFLGTGGVTASYYQLSANNSGFTGVMNLTNARINDVAGGTLNWLGNPSMINVSSGSSVGAGFFAKYTFNQPLNLAGLGWAESAGTLGALRLQSGSIWAGPITLTANARIGVYNGSTGVLAGSLAGAYELELWGTGASSITNAATANTTAGTRINGTVSVIAASAAALSPGPLTMAGGTNKLMGFSFAFANLTSTTAACQVQNGSSTTPATLTVGADDSSTTYSGTLANGGAAALGLTKIGAGALMLTAANTYTGPTTVSRGTLLVNGSLAAGSALTVQSGATLGGSGTIGGVVSVQDGGCLALGASIGTMTLNISPLLAGTTLMEISKGATPNADKLVVNGQPLTYGGTLTVTNIGTNALALGDAFTLFNAPSYSGNFSATNLPPLAPGLKWNWAPTSGTLSVVVGVDLTPTSLVASVSSGQLTLTWPADHTGWRLLAQTNSLAAGLNGNWFDVDGSTATNQIALPIDPLNPSVFYRLTYP